MKNFLTWLSSNKYLGSHLDIRARIFNLLDFGGMFLGVTVGLSCIFLTDAGWLQAGLNFAAALLAVFMLWYADHSGRYRFCYTLTVVVVFIVAFPILFFTGGGYHSGMPSYFVFAIVFTVLILEGKRLIALAGLEAAIYIACFIIAYRYPETVVPFRAEFDTAMDIFVGFAGAGFALTAVMLLHLQFYRDYNAMLDEKAEILEQANKMKSEFLSNVAHELQTPLTVISNYAQYTESLLGDERLDIPELKYNMRGFVYEVERVSRMVDQLRDLTAIERGGVSLNICPVSLPEIVETVGKIHFPMMNANKNALTVYFPPDLPLVRADKERLTQVFINLLSNAARHTNNGSIAIAAKREDDTLLVSVTDDGAGIAPELLPQLFTRYMKAENGRVAGTGLGLYICRIIITALGGEIWVESTPGKGTAVRFRLPVTEGK